MPPEGASPEDPREWLRRARSNLARRAWPTMVFDNTCAAVNAPIREQRMAIFNVLGLTT